MTIFFPESAAAFKLFAFEFQAMMIQFCLFSSNYFVFAVYLETIPTLFYFLILIQMFIVL